MNKEELQRLFGVLDRVTSMTVVRDRVTHVPTGFANVQMPDAKEAEMATASVNRIVLKGQAVVVNKNRPHFEHH